MIRFNFKSCFYLFLGFLTVLLLSLLYLHRDVNMEAVYVTSNKCQACHTSHYNSWRENSLHPYMFLPVSSPDAKILGDFESNDPAVTFTKEEIEFVLGSRWEQVYAHIIDGEYYILPAKWYVIEKRWVPYKVDDWRETPMSSKCNGCHTTGFDPNTMEFSEFGIGCEACHGPGSRHVQHESKAHRKICTFCHSGDSGNEKREGRFIISSVSPTICAQCHNRGTTSTGDIVKGVQFNFPAGFKPGDDLASTDFTPSTPATDKKKNHWWGSGLAKNRHQEFSDWSRSAHANSLTDLLESHADAERKRGELSDECLFCHSTDYRHSSEEDQPDLYSARFGVTCVACHEPHGHDSQQPGFKDGRTVCNGCHNEQDSPHEEWIHLHPCATERAGCADCHMPRIVRTGGFFSLRSHAFQIVPPAATKGSDMPNSCQNGGCHADKTVEWAIKAYDDFLLKEREQRRVK
ncbi:MAG: multiheme c-type cytochrome [Thermodesulfobacteriota bacterium]